MNVEFITLNDKKYAIKRVMPTVDVTEANLPIVKLLWGSDLVLKKNGLHYFVAEIPDAEWVDIDDISPIKAISGEKPDIKVKKDEGLRT